MSDQSEHALPAWRFGFWPSLRWFCSDLRSGGIQAGKLKGYKREGDRHVYVA